MYQHQYYTNMRESTFMSNNAHPQSSFFEVTCQKGHTTTFDKYDVCNRGEVVTRGDGKRLPMEELFLKCKTCGIEMSVEIDCGGYRYS